MYLHDHDHDDEHHLNLRLVCVQSPTSSKHKGWKLTLDQHIQWSRSDTNFLFVYMPRQEMIIWDLILLITFGGEFFTVYPLIFLLQTDLLVKV